MPRSGANPEGVSVATREQASVCAARRRRACEAAPRLRRGAQASAASAGKGSCFSNLTYPLIPISLKNSQNLLAGFLPVLEEGGEAGAR